MGSALGKAVVEPTGKLYGLRVEVGGFGYEEPPAVTIPMPAGSGRRATAKAVLGKDGVLEAVELIDAGEGYSPADEPLKVEVEPPMAYVRQLETIVTDSKPRTAIVRGVLDYGVARVDVVRASDN